MFLGNEGICWVITVRLTQMVEMFVQNESQVRNQRADVNSVI